MCGIIAINSKTNITKKLIFGLKALEYRGYDSAGIAFLEGFEIFKTTISIDSLEKMVQKNKQKIGIGHTRWATHGKIALENTHPIFINHACLVHNGIIENLEEIKQKIEYQAKGETDTEIFLAFILSVLKRTAGNNFKERALKALEISLKEVKGSFAAAILFAHEETIFWVKKGISPLIIATNEESTYITSDQEAILEAATIFEIPENSFGFIENESFEIFPKTETKEYKIEEKKIEIKNHEKSFMEEEISEQIDIWNKLKSMPIEFDLSKYDQILLTACGSAYITCMLGALWLEEEGISAKAEIASEWNMRESAEKNALVIVVSQSGETADTLLAMKKAKSKGLDTLAIINRENSSIAKLADFVISIHSGIEKSVASTKAFTAQAIRLFQLAKKRNLNLEQLGLAALSVDISEAIQKIASSPLILIIGKNKLYATANEGALKLKEITYINIEAYPAGELKHGYLALVDENCYTIVLNPEDEHYYNKILSNSREIQARNGKIILISSRNDLNADIFIPIPQMNYDEAAIIYTLIFQRIALEVAKMKHLPIDKPRNLAKSVTVE